MGVGEGGSMDPRSHAWGILGDLVSTVVLAMMEPLLIFFLFTKIQFFVKDQYMGAVGGFYSSASV